MEIQTEDNKPKAPQDPGRETIMAIIPGVFGTPEDIDLFVKDNGAQGIYDLNPDGFGTVDDVTQLLGLGKQSAGVSSGPSAEQKLPSSMTGDQLKAMGSRYGISMPSGLDWDAIASEASGKTISEGVAIIRDYKQNPKKSSLGNITKKLISMGYSQQEIDPKFVLSVTEGPGTPQEKLRKLDSALKANRAQILSEKKAQTSPEAYAALENPDFTLGSVNESIYNTDEPQDLRRESLRDYETNQRLISKVSEYTSSDPNKQEEPESPGDKEAFKVAKAVYNQNPGAPASAEYAAYVNLLGSQEKDIKNIRNLMSEKIENVTIAGGWGNFYNYKTDRIDKANVDAVADDFARENGLQIGGPAWMLFRGDLEAKAHSEYTKPAF